MPAIPDLELEKAEEMFVEGYTADRVQHQGFDMGTAFLLTLLSGICTGLGGMVMVLMGSPSVAFVGRLEGFSAGVMVMLSARDMIYPSYEVNGINGTVLGFVLGVAMFWSINRLIPEPDGDYCASLFGTDKRELMTRGFMRTAFVLALGISMHNLPEGIAVFLSSLNAPKLGVMMAISMAIHNITEGMAVAAPIYFSTRNAMYAVLLPLVSGLFEPLGALAAGMVLHPVMTNEVLHFLLAVVAGIMVLLSTSELYPLSYRHTGLWPSVAAATSGMFVCHMTLYITEEFA